YRLQNAKRSLEKNHNDAYSKCPCTEAKAMFDNEIRGFVTFTQEECGDTQVSGIFATGLLNPPYEFFITDKCGNIIRNITQDLNVEYCNNGTKPFSAKLSNLNLNCDFIRSLQWQTPGSGGADMVVNGDPSATAGIYP
ncbi:28534_t:CDS:2, partial [Dentiscutata erythropus]